MEETQVCSMCGVEQPLERFRVFKGKYRAKYCRTCGNKWSTAANKRKYHANPELAREKSQAQRFGLTHKELILMKTQFGGKCGICRKEANLHMDHDHNTGQVRGLLCGPCNAALGMFQDNPILLEKAAAYLEVHS